MQPEEERLEQIKEWWKEYRLTIIIGVTLGIGGIGGVNGWLAYSKSQSEQASDIYERLTAAVVEKNFQEALDSWDELSDRFSNSNYAEQAEFMVARAYYEMGNSDQARQILEGLLENANQSQNVHLARIQLSRLLIANREYDSALTLLSINDMSQYESHYQELRGDAYLGMRNLDEANAAYARSIEALQPNARSYRSVLELKLNETLVDQ